MPVGWGCVSLTLSTLVCSTYFPFPYTWLQVVILLFAWQEELTWQHGPPIKFTLEFPTDGPPSVRKSKVNPCDKLYIPIVCPDIHTKAFTSV